MSNCPKCDDLESFYRAEADLINNPLPDPEPMKLTIKSDTVLKPSVDQASKLDASVLRPLPAGTTLDFDNITVWKNHYRCVHASMEVFYLFLPHCEVVNGCLPYWDVNAPKTSIISACRFMGITDKNQIAYVLATVKHETGNKFQPIEEYYGRSQAIKLHYDGGAEFFGRGFVQLTHRYNYAKFSKLLGIDLVANPALALRGDISLFILIYGMINGTFTGKRLSYYFNPNYSDFVEARRIINGKDKAELIADYAQKVLKEIV